MAIIGAFLAHSPTAAAAFAIHREKVCVPSDRQIQSSYGVSVLRLDQKHAPSNEVCILSAQDEKAITISGLFLTMLNTFTWCSLS